MFCQNSILICQNEFWFSQNSILICQNSILICQNEFRFSQNGVMICGNKICFLQRRNLRGLDPRRLVARSGLRPT